MIRRSLCVIVVAFALAMPVAASGQTTPARPGVVAGVVFHDRDLDGVRDINEEALLGWEIDASTADAVNSGRLALSDADGAYRIEDVDSALSNWQLDAFWPFDTPFTHFYKIELPQPAPLAFYGGLARADIPVAYDDDSAVTFHVWEDFDGDGAISAGDELSLYTDIRITDSSGANVFEGSGALSSLTLTGLLPGDYVAEATMDPLNRAAFTVPERDIRVRPVDLLSKPHVALYGYVYDDSDQSGTFDPGEPRLPGAEVDEEERYPDGSSGGVGAYTGPDGDFVMTFDSTFTNQDVYVGCGNAPPPEPPGPETATDQQGHWRGTREMTFRYQQVWFQDTPVHVDGPGHYRIDCGLVWIPPQRWSPSAAPSPLRLSGEDVRQPEGTIDITLPPSGTGDSPRPRLPCWPALALLASGVVLTAVAPFCKSKRPDPKGTRPRNQ